MYKYKLIAIEARRVEDNHKRLHRNAFPKIKKYHIEIKSVCLFVLNTYIHEKLNIETLFIYRIRANRAPGDTFGRTLVIFRPN